MSDVRLSNGSPPLERVDARLADHARPPVCRNLFGSGGTGDEAELRRDCAEQLRDMQRASQERWNYDFERDKPLSPGRYVWEEVDSRQLPEFYSRPLRGPRPERAPPRTCISFTPSPSQENGEHEPEREAERASPTSPSLESSDASSSCRKTRKRPSTEHQESDAQTKKEKSDEEDTNHCADESPSVEQTPKKSHPNT